MKSKLWLIAPAVLLLTTLVWATVWPEIKSEDETYSVYSWDVNANGFRGLLEYTVVGKRIYGTVLGDPIEGYQVGRHIVFYRVSRADQLWNGWMSDASYEGDPKPIISGTFSHRGENSYPWHGSVPSDVPDTTEEPDDSLGGRGR